MEEKAYQDFLKSLQEYRKVDACIKKMRKQQEERAKQIEKNEKKIKALQSSKQNAFKCLKLLTEASAASAGLDDPEFQRILMEGTNYIENHNNT